MTTEPWQPLLLLVDDSPEIALIVQRFAKKAGYCVVSCEDVPSAWAWLSSSIPDLLILDVNLPGESGLALCARIRTLPRLRSLPIAIFSHWDHSEDIAAGLRKGADFVLSKELLCDFDRWRDRVAELLTPVDGRPARVFLSFSEAGGFDVSAAQCGRAVRLALQQPTFATLDRDVLSVLLDRAALEAGLNRAPESRQSLRSSWCFELLEQAPPEKALRFGFALMEQLWCVMGQTSSAPYIDALASSNPVLAEFLGQR